MLERRVVGMEGERDEGLKAAGLVLQAAELEQVVDPVFVVFDVAVEHGGVGFEAYLVGYAGGVEPLIAIDFVVADDVADAVGEDFGAAPGKRVDSGGLELLEGLADRELGALGQVGDFHHREGLEVDLREALLEAGAKIQKILER